MTPERAALTALVCLLTTAAAAQSGAPIASSPTPATPTAPSRPAPAGAASTPPAAAPVRPASPAPATSPAPPSDQALAAALATASQHLQSNDCTGVLAALDPVLPGLTGDKRQIVQRLRITCLLPVGRTADANAAYAELAAAAPTDAAVRVLGVALAMDEQDFRTAATRLATTAEEQPAALRRIETRLVKQLRQALAPDRTAKPLSDRLDLALALAGWRASDDPDLELQIRANAVGVLAARGDSAGASELLAGISDPELLSGMAIEREYQSVWPAIETQLGPNSAPAADAFAAERLAVYANQPNDDRSLRDAIRAFAMLNRAQDAADLAGPIPIADHMSEEQVAAVRYGAQALVALGRRDDALARLQKFQFVDLKTTPAAISGLVEYAELLDDSGKPQEALAAAKSAADKGRAVLSPWGMGWLERTEACTLGTLAAAAPAKAAGDALVQQADQNPPAAIEGLLCLGRKDEAARIAVKTLNQPDGADMLADQFQPQGASWLAAPSRLRDLWGPLLARPDVKSAFDKVARILPRSLWPLPTPRPIPRDRGAPSGRHLA